jgi:hypothetical protein
MQSVDFECTTESIHFGKAQTRPVIGEYVAWLSRKNVLEA